MDISDIFDASVLFNFLEEDEKDDDPLEITEDITGISACIIKDEVCVAECELRHVIDIVIDEEQKAISVISPFVELDGNKICKSTLVSQLLFNKEFEVSKEKKTWVCRSRGDKRYMVLRKGYGNEKNIRLCFEKGNEVSEKIASFGLTWCMILYLVRVYNLARERAAYILTITSRISGFGPLIGGFLADAYLGRYRSIVIGSISNLMGMICLLLTSTISTLTPCDSKHYTHRKECDIIASNRQLYFLYLAFMLLAIGAGGLRSSSYAFGADQFSPNTIEEGRQLQSFFNWYYVGVNVALLVASTIVAYVQLEVSWAWGFAIPTALMAISIIIFLAGSPLYYHVIPSGSAYAVVARVIVAAFYKRKLSLPPNPKRKLHYNNIDNKQSDFTTAHTDQFRFLDKAALQTEEEDKKLLSANANGAPIPISKWRLCKMEEVEYLKSIMRVLPIWLSGVLPAAYLLQLGIWVPLQATLMNLHVGNIGFKIPESSMIVFSIVTVMLWLPFSDKVFVPMWRRQRLLASDPIRGVTLLQRIGIGHILVILSPIIGALVETQRRSKSNGTMHVMWLSPQLIVLGVADAFNIVGQVEYLYSQVPPQMKSMATALFSCTWALGSFVGTIAMAIVQKISHGVWLKNDIDQGHLKYYYYFFTGILSLNCIYYFCLVSSSAYRRLPESDIITKRMTHEANGSYSHITNKHMLYNCSKLLVKNAMVFLKFVIKLDECELVKETKVERVTITLMNRALDESISANDPRNFSVQSENNIFLLATFKHIICNHISWFARQYESLAIWSTQGMEKTHYQARTGYFSHTRHGGGADKANSLEELHQWTYRKLMHKSHRKEQVKDSQISHAVRLASK
ncbi:hypothetical protein L7F22_012899 [Adiantum nelumboides]|nr:hypothetical protein [Adiantum nelumboides]